MAYAGNGGAIMPRPAKCKRVCAPPAFPRFGPAGETRGETVEMSVEEYETIRLIDWEQMTQEECSQQMQGSDHPSVLSPSEAAPRVPCSAVGLSLQERY